MAKTLSVLLLAYAGCDTCKKARKYLDTKAVEYTLRPIVDEPPTVKELARWIPASGVGVRKWLNTSGQSYRALGKAKIDVASDAEITKWLAADGKLVKRPVLVVESANARAGSASARVVVGFRPDREDAYDEALAGS